MVEMAGELTPYRTLSFCAARREYPCLVLLMIKSSEELIYYLPLVVVVP